MCYTKNEKTIFGQGSEYSWIAVVKPCAYSAGGDEINRITILQGHVLDRLKELPENSVHCCITSPPYFGLRDYGIEPQIWPDGWRGSYGLEPTIDLYVQHTVEIFREVRRVLRKDGVCFLNVGDSYAASGGSGSDEYSKRHKQFGKIINQGTKVAPRSAKNGLKPKDLCLVPARVALALQADGWWVRSEITWVKPNPLPESVTDRPTKSTEKIYLLTKSAKYFWDGEAVREKANPDNQRNAGVNATMAEGNATAGNDRHINYEKNRHVVYSRNLRDAWTIATEPFPEAHFATFPQRLVETCLKAGTSERGCCPKCGAPWMRVVEKGQAIQQHWAPGTQEKIHLAQGKHGKSSVLNTGFIHKVQTIAWRPSCKCELPDSHVGLDLGDLTIPCTVLDPFGGSGTVGLVAAKMGRDAIIIELKPEYCDMAGKRIRGALGMLADVEIK